MLESRQILYARLEHQLGTLVSSVKIAIRANLASSNVAAENTLMELLNRIYGWNLVNANSISQNYAGVDLIDIERNIAIQVTSTRTTKKVRHTLEEVAKLDTTFDRLILLIITDQSATTDMKACAGTMELWNIPDVYRDAIALDTDRLREIIDLMDKELGTIRSTLEDLPHLELPLGSRLESSGFVGREEELENIRSRFAAGDKLVVLTGLGGMGKTELAVRFGKTYTSGAVYFTRFSESFTRTLANMANGIQPKLSQEELSRPTEALCEMVMDILGKCGEHDLLIIDNVDADRGRLNDLMQDSAYRRLTALELRLLLTTRFERPQALRIDPMGDEMLYQIFEKYEACPNRQEMKALIDAVNGHTLTIDLIARTLADNWEPVSAEEMLTELAANRLDNEAFAEVETHYNQSPEQVQIYRHLQKVFQVAKIPETEQNILRCATLLPQSGMDFDLFRESLPEDWRRSLAPLGRRGWLTKEGSLLSIHPVIRLVCREELKPGDNCTAFLNALWGQLGRDEYDRIKYTQLAEVFANAVEIAQNVEVKANRVNFSGRLWLELMESRRAAALYEQYLPDLERHLPDHPALATACNNVGMTYVYLGDHQKALEYLLKAMTIREKVLPKEHPDLVISYNNVGSTYSDLGDYEKALEYLLQALAIREKVLPENPPQLATSYNNVGMTYDNLCDYEKALEYLLQALAIREKVLPENHPDLAASYNNVGMTYGNLGDHEKALEYKLKALTLCEKMLPENHPQLAISYNNVGSTYSDLGDHQKTLEQLQKALVIQEKVLPENHPQLAASCNNIAWTYYEMGRLQEAARYMRRAADIVSRSSLPEDHPYRVNFTKWVARFETEARMQQAMMEQMKQWGMNPFHLPGK